MIDVGRIARYPPFVCRVIARKTVVINGRRSVVPVSAADISELSGLSVKRVAWIGSQPSWDNITVLDMKRFLRGCQLLDKPVWRWRWFLTRAAGKVNALQHLDKLPRQDRKRVCDAYVRHQQAWLQGIQSV